jgi:hypothetical protein
MSQDSLKHFPMEAFYRTISGGLRPSSCSRGSPGQGKTTISRLAPPDATLLTDEISYLRREGDGYIAYGTPLAGELAQRRA